MPPSGLFAFDSGVVRAPICSERLLLNLVIVLAMRRVERWLAVPGFVIGGGR